jgi:choline dehydrogenase-like flavoprotein
LELSEIGHGGRLQQLFIPVLHESAGVGKNLMDYLRVAISMRCLYPIYEYGTRSPFI